MAIYTFQSSRSNPRLAGKTVVVDSSYLIALSDPNDNFYNDVANFHQTALQSSTGFVINVIIRQEFLKQIRAVQFIEAILRAVSQDPILDNRYKTVLGRQPTTQFTSANLKREFDKLFKDHARKNDIGLLTPYLSKDVWNEVRRLENETGMTYSSRAGSVPWDALGELMADTGLAPTDAMIANFANKTDADAILTTDCDFAQVTDMVDVYMPFNIATLCDNYDPSID